MFRRTSDNYGDYYTFTQDNLNQFNVTTIKNVKTDENDLGFIVISENANEIKTAIDERRAFVIRTAISVGFVILIFSFVLSRYFIKPIQNLVGYINLVISYIQLSLLKIVNHIIKNK